ncbi:hypothetical protein MPNT_130049 [Candidatus Methylacidithermus pantelleriae]|uniref:Uncharacterized protein n=1 Tax=Candidatus Methylacidithermus pantelleriae TaxID=2744239 RepID=A0A8J2BRA1_9BACT|nr:hypothetical protein MPNT_130049 [Candidatus Methylacidithermus pantelleriae]
MEERFWDTSACAGAKKRGREYWWEKRKKNSKCSLALLPREKVDHQAKKVSRKESPICLREASLLCQSPSSCRSSLAL